MICYNFGPHYFGFFRETLGLFILGYIYSQLFGFPLIRFWNLMLANIMYKYSIFYISFIFKSVQSYELPLKCVHKFLWPQKIHNQVAQWFHWWMWSLRFYPLTRVLFRSGRSFQRKLVPSNKWWYFCCLSAAHIFVSFLKIDVNGTLFFNSFSSYWIALLDISSVSILSEGFFFLHTRMRGHST